MNDVVGSARVELRANVRALRRDLQQGRDETRRIARDMQDSANRAEVALTGVGREFSREMTRARASVAGLNGDLSQAATLAAAFTAALGGTAAVRSIVDQADAFNLLRARLSTVVTAGESTEAVFARLFAQAQANRAPLATVVDLYTRLRQSIAGLGDTEAASIVQVLSRSLALSGASAAETSSFLRQIGQALSSGVLRGEEFNAVLESNARFARLLADQLGVSIGELRGLAEQGRLTADVVRGAIAGGAAEIALEYESLPGTVGGAFQQLQNALLRYVGETDASLGASRRLAEGITGLANNFDKVADAAILAGIALAGNVGGRGVQAGINRTSEALEIAAAQSLELLRTDTRRFEAAQRYERLIQGQVNRQLGRVESARRAVADYERALAALRSSNVGIDPLRDGPRIRDALNSGAPINLQDDVYRDFSREARLRLEQIAVAQGRLASANGELIAAQRELEQRTTRLTAAQGRLSEATVAARRHQGQLAEASRRLATAGLFARNALSGLVNLLGGPLPIILGAAAVALAVYRSEAEKAAAAQRATASGLEVLASAAVNVESATGGQAEAQRRAADETGRLRDLTNEAAEAADTLTAAQTRGAKAADTQAKASAALAEVRRAEAVQTVATALAEAELERARLERELREFRTQSARYDQYLGDPRLAQRRQGRESELETAIGQLERSIPILRDGLAALEGGFLTVGGGAAAVAQTTPEAAAALVQIRNTASEAGEAVRDVGRSFVELSEEASAPDGDVATPELERAREIALGARDELARLKADLEEVQALTRQGVFSGIGREQEGARALVDLLEQIARASGEAKFALDVLAKAELPGVDRKQAQRDIRRAASDGKAERDEARESYFQPREIRNDLKNAFVEAARSGDWREAFANALETAAGRALGRAVDRTLGGAVDIGLDVAGGLLQKALSAGLKGAASFLPGRAGGGRVYGGQAYETGEAGRELFIPDQSGTVIGARALRAAMSGDGGGKRGGDIYIDARGASPGVETRIRAAIEEAAELGASRGEARVMRRMDAVRSRSR